MAGEFQGREGTMQQVGQGVQSLIRQDQYANLAVSQSLPPWTDLALNNKLYVASSAAGTNLAPLNAPLTTAARWLLYNPADSGKVLIVKRCWVVLESGTRSIGSSLWGCITQAAEATAPTTYASSIKKGLGHTGTASGIFAGNVTLDATEAWACLVGRDVLADANESSALVYEDGDGWIIVPENRSFAISLRDAGAGTTPLYGGGFVWAELPLRQA